MVRCFLKTGSNLIWLGKEAWAKRIYIKSFVSKLSDSLGEEFETEVWLHFSKDCDYIDEETCNRLMEGYDEVRKMLISMMNHP